VACEADGHQRRTARSAAGERIGPPRPLGRDRDAALPAGTAAFLRENGRATRAAPGQWRGWQNLPPQEAAG
jgi:hypothetical protein